VSRTVTYSSSYTIVPVASYKCRGADTVGRLGGSTPGPGLGPDEVQFQIKTKIYEGTVSLGDEAILLVPMAGGVFDARCTCSIVGVN